MSSKLVAHKDDTERKSAEKTRKIWPRKIKFDKDIRLLRQCKHPCLISWLEENVDKPFIRMFIQVEDHRDLKTYMEIHKNEHLSEILVLKLTYQLSLALDYLHSRGIIHSNVNEETIWLNDQDDCKLAEYGLLGTVKYRAPELIRNNNAFSNKSDTWALGCVIYSMCTLHDRLTSPQEKVLAQQKTPRISTQLYSSKMQNLIDDLLEYKPISRLGADILLKLDLFETTRGICKEFMLPNQWKRIDLHFRTAALEKTMKGLKSEFASNKNIITQCTGKDILLLIGNTGSGKSTLYNYLMEAPLKECTQKELNIPSLNPNKKVISMESDNDKKFAVIGQGTGSQTETPNISPCNKMIVCDCPGFNATPGIEVQLSNAVRIKSILKNGNSCKLIVVIPYEVFDDSKLCTLRDTTQLIKKVFLSEEMHEKHKTSVSFCITKLPEREERETAYDISQLKDWLRSTNDPLIETIADYEFIIYDPLSRQNRLYGPIPTREELLTQIEKIPFVPTPSRVFGTCLSDTEERKIIKFEDDTFHLVSELLECNETILQAANIYQLFFDLQVLEHQIVKESMKKIKERVTNIFEKKQKETDELAKNKENERAVKQMKEFGKMRQLFLREGNDSILKEMWEKYKNHKYNCLQTFALKGCGYVVLGSVATAGLAVVCPYIPMAVAGGIRLGLGLSGGGTVMTGGVAAYIYEAWSLFYSNAPTVDSNTNVATDATTDVNKDVTKDVTKTIPKALPKT